MISSIYTLISLTDASNTSSMYYFDNLYGIRKEILINSTSSILQRFTVLESLPCFSQIETYTAVPGL